ncbi:MAG TPA: FUSC family protein [Candidatus Sulfotelmatobacter sp.]|nr:FUSC family protein [Candidatus Sulfotelmatobacter sp.]
MGERIRDRVLIADPGLARLDTAARTTAAVALTTVVLLAFADRHGGAQVVVLVGAIASWISGIAVNDVTVACRRLTTALVPLPAIGGLALASATMGDVLHEDLVFLVVLFVSIYIRRYGPRWTALGIVATFAYFFGLFVEAQTALLPALAGALVLGTASTFFTRFVVLPKHRRGSLFWVIEAVRAQLRLVLEETARPASADDRAALVVMNNARVNETMLAVQEQGVVAGMFDDLIFRTEVAAENWTVVHVGLDADRGHRAATDRALAEVIAEVHHVTPSAAGDPNASSPQRNAIVTEATKSGDAVAYRLRPSTRQAIQVTLAAALAIVLGERIAPDRWYWAVLTTFVVYTGTTSAGETLARAWAAFLGTVLGVVVGTGAGLLVRHDVTLESVVLFLGLLFAAYFLRVGLGVAWFFVTVCLVMIYELLGRFTEGVLLTRLFEVATGVVCGGLAAFVILPTSTRRIFRADARAALQALRDGIDTIAGGGVADAQSASRRFDAAVRRLRTRVRPLRSGPTFAGASRFARLWLRSVELCTYYARNAACAPRDQPGAAVVAGVGQTLDRLSNMIDDDPAWPNPSATPPDPAEPAFVEGSAAAFVAALGAALDRLVETPRPTAM